MSIGAKIKRIRTDMGLNQSNFSNLIEVTTKTLRRWEKGETIPNFYDVCRISKKTNVPITYFCEADIPADNVSGNK
ncbi:MAG: helix-turn-helix transcriptional regulator [Erysipelotrichales bacterium]|nr:helix-turn-helix transcriptional regulator [Erysipelotrichales bacterium]